MEAGQVSGSPRATKRSASLQHTRLQAQMGHRWPQRKPEHTHRVDTDLQISPTTKTLVPFCAPSLTARQARQPMRRHAPRPGRSSTTGTNEPDDQTTTTPHMARDDATTMLRPDHCAQLGRFPGVRGRAPYLWRQQGWRTTANLGHHPKEGHVNAWAGRGKSSKTDRA